MTVENDSQLEGLMAAGKAVRGAFEHMKAAARPGMTTAELDDLGRRRLEAAGATSAPQFFYDFPGATCISVNEEAAHGIPGERVLREGDVVNIDVSAVRDGYVADMGESFVLGQAADRRAAHICRAVQRCVEAAIAEVRSGRSLNVIGAAVSRLSRRFGYSIVENLGSHGVGQTLHEEPSYVPRDDPRERRRLTRGLVLTIEPFLTTGPAWVEEQPDGWTLSVPGGELVAQFEQTVVVTDRGALVVTA